MKDVNFQVPLDVFKKELMKQPNGEEVGGDGDGV